MCSFWCHAEHQHLRPPVRQALRLLQLLQEQRVLPQPLLQLRQERLVRLPQGLGLLRIRGKHQCRDLVQPRRRGRKIKKSDIACAADSARGERRLLDTVLIHVHRARLGPRVIPGPSQFVALFLPGNHG